MVEINEVFEDFGENAKKVFKNKKFLIAAVAVGGIALISGYLKYRDQEQSEDIEAVTGFEAIGYAGYPTVNGGGGSEGDNYYSDTSYYEGLLSDMQAQYQSDLLDFQAQYDSDMDLVNSNVEALTDKLLSSEEALAQTQQAMQTQQVISQMQANSELYNALRGSEFADERQALHEENKALAESIGATFDNDTGNWYTGTGVLYTTAQQRAGIVGGKTTTGGTNSTNVTFDTNVDYQAKINKAILSGGSAAEINQLNAQRNAKIAATGNNTVTYDKNTNYAALIQKAKAAGADQSTIDNLNAQRNAKIAAMK